MEHSKKPAFKSALDFHGRPLATCLETIAEQLRLLRIVRAALPAEIADHATHCVLAGTCLLIYTDAASWASQIRFFHQVILNKLQVSGQHNIVRLQFKVVPPVAERTSGRSAQVPSAETVGRILGQVDDKSNDVLEVALSRLAETLRKRLPTKPAAK